MLSDNELGASLAVNHLAELGHRRILHLATPLTDGYHDRRRGYVDAIHAAGLRPEVVTFDHSHAAAARDMTAAVDPDAWPTAVFTHNDQTALGVLDALHTRGVDVPGRMSVIGYDNTTASQPPGIAPTTVDRHGEQFGRRAAKVALARIDDPTGPDVDENFPPTLVVRGTTASPDPIGSARRG